MGRWFIVAPKTPVLLTVKETKDQKYNRSIKGQARNYRRYKKILADRIYAKEIKLLQLEKELLNATKI